MGCRARGVQARQQPRWLPPAPVLRVLRCVCVSAHPPTHPLHPPRVPAVHRHEFDSHLGPYALKTWRTWQPLVDSVSDGVLERCLPVSGRIVSTAAVLAREAAAGKAAAALGAAPGVTGAGHRADAEPGAADAHAGAEAGAGAAVGTAGGVADGSAGVSVAAPAPVVASGSRFFFSPVLGVGPGAKGPDITRFALDTSPALLFLLGRCGTEPWVCADVCGLGSVPGLPPTTWPRCCQGGRGWGMLVLTRRSLAPMPWLCPQNPGRQRTASHRRDATHVCCVFVGPGADGALRAGGGGGGMTSCFPHSRRCEPAASAARVPSSRLRRPPPFPPTRAGFRAVEGAGEHGVPM